MSTTTPLFELLPIVYRLRDAENGGPLEALLDLISEQVDLLRTDLEGLWDDLFIETCNEWVVPYIGDLVANTPLYEIPGVSRRVDVASTIDWRRRKGTPPMLGALARGVTGWGALAVATFELLSWNQNLNHLRMLAAPEIALTPGIALPPHPFALDRVGTVNVRDRDCLDRVNGAFDQITHTVDLRKITDHHGWYGIHKVCFFCFRLVAFPMEKMVPATSPTGPAGCYHFSPLGQDAPVFHVGVPVPSADVLADENNVDAPIRPYRFFLDPGLDVGQRLNVYTDGTTPVAVGDVICKDLSAWPDVPDDKVAIDVRSGRLRFGANYAYTPEKLLVDAAYGFSASVGGGPYTRTNTPVPSDEAVVLTVSATDPAATFTDIESAVAHWQTLPPTDAQIVILDSGTYRPAGGTLDLSWTALTSPVHLSIVAAGEKRPLIVGNIGVAGTQLARLALDGLLISGCLSVAGPVQWVRLTDCTLVPGIALNGAGTAQQPAAPSLTCDAPSDTRTVTLANCLTGPLFLAAEANHLTVTDSIIDAPAGPDPAAPRVALAADATGKVAGPEVDLERVTVFGSVLVRELTLASESIFTDGTLRAERRQAGCVRFSSLVLAGSRTPQRYRCQPDLARQAAGDPAAADAAERRVRPIFTNVHYGQPAYGQLSPRCAPEIRQGADEGAEMGAFRSLLQPYRETNLRVRLTEYLPVGLEPGIVHVT